jgi:hypothetical protein
MLECADAVAAGFLKQRPKIETDTKNQTPERLPSPVSDVFLCSLRFLRNQAADWPVHAAMISKCSQQNRTYKSEHGQYHEHVELHGKVHRRCSILVDVAQV